MAARSAASLSKNFPSALGLGIILAVVAVAVGAGAALWHGATYTDRVYPGVSAFGVDLGGKTADEARPLLEARFAEASSAQLSLRQGTSHWPTTPADLGLGIDAAQTINNAYLVGREGDATSRVIDQMSALSSGRAVSAQFVFDEAKAYAVLGPIGDEIKRSPANAGLLIGTDGTVQVRPGQTGLNLDTDRAVKMALNAAATLKAGDLELPVTEVPVNLATADVEKARTKAQSIIGQPLVLTNGSKSWSIAGADLVGLVRVTDGDNSLDVGLDDARLEAQLQKIAAEIRTPSSDSMLTLKGKQVEISPGTDGQELDLKSSATMIKAQIGQGAPMALVVKKTSGLTPIALADLKARAEALLASSTPFVYQDKAVQLTASDLAAALVIKTGADDSPPTLDLDAEKLTPFLKTLAKQVDREPRDARFKVAGGQVSIVAESVDGLTVDGPATTNALRAGLAKPGQPVQVQVRVTKAEVSSAALSQLSFTDIIMDSSTSYAGAIPAKVHNIQLAISRLNGTVVPPGSTFSFNKALGPATLSSGFELGYGIALNSKGDMETVPSEAGGICQVASTLFHSVFWSGYPIVERNWHMYWIPKYGLPPRGLKGLDATVDDGYNVDFKFKNNTKDWISIEASATGGTVRFALRGVKPTWKVTVGTPKVTNVVAAHRELVRQPDPTMPDGQTLYVEAPEDGFDVSIDRTVTDGDTVVDKWTAKSHYRPSRNVMLVGTKGAKVAATPTAGTPAAGTPGVGTPAAGTPGAGTPAAGTPAAGTPAAGTPVSTAPPNGTPPPSASPTPKGTPVAQPSPKPSAQPTKPPAATATSKPAKP